MKQFQLIPRTRLDESVVESLIVHSTPSGLRKAGAMSPCIKRVKGSSEIPTLYYIWDKSIEDWRIHVLVADANRYLLLNSIESPVVPPTPKPEVPTFKFEWDGLIGGDITTDPEFLTESGSPMVIKDSVIEYYDESKIGILGSPLDEGEFEPGNYIGFKITADGDLSAYADGIVTLNTQMYGELKKKISEVFSDQGEFEFVAYVPKSYEGSGPEYSINIRLDEENSVNFVAQVRMDSCVLESPDQVIKDAEALTAALIAGGDVVLGSDIQIDSMISIPEGVVTYLDLADYSIINRGTGAAIEVKGYLAISGKGTIDGGQGGNNKAILVSGGQLVIDEGNFTVGPDAAGDGNSCIENWGGSIEINGGSFSSDAAYNDWYFVLNQKNNNPGTIHVTGGRFLNYDPSKGDDNLGGNFVAEGHKVVELEGGWYEVVIDE